MTAGASPGQINSGLGSACVGNLETETETDPEAVFEGNKRGEFDPPTGSEML
jgi:hypothetical protein